MDWLDFSFEVDDLYQEFQRKIDLPQVENLHAPNAERYSEIDSWAMRQIDAIRSEMDFNLRFSFAAYSPSLDWYLSEGDWLQSAKERANQTSDPWFWTSIEGVYLLQHGDRDDLDNGQRWLRLWLDSGGHDFENFVDSASVFRKDCIEIDEFLDDCSSITICIYGCRSGHKGCCDRLQESILADYSEGIEILANDAITLPCIQHHFQPSELQPVREWCLDWANARHGSRLNSMHNDVVTTAIRLDWRDVLDALSMNPRFRHVVWCSLADQASIMYHFKRSLNGFKQHMSAGDYPQKGDVLGYLKGLEQRMDQAIFEQFRPRELLLWTLSHPKRKWVRDVFAIQISDTIKAEKPGKFDSESRYLAIGWSRIRAKEMQAT